MIFSPILKRRLQEARNTQLEIKSISVNIYLVKCVLGETILQGESAIQLEKANIRLMKQYPGREPRECLLIAANPILELFKNPFFNNPSLVSKVLQG